jgi:gliding motility-associated-like protein
MQSGPVQVKWYFGDGDSSTASSVVHNYQTHGVYFPQLITESDNGCLDTMDGRVEVYAMPVATFALSDTALCYKDHSISVFNNASIAEGQMTYRWDFGDGIQKDTNEYEVKHAYAQYGKYRITFTATSEKACADTSDKEVEIYESPVAQFQLPDSLQCLRSNAFSFNSDTKMQSGPVQVKWYFGDGNSSTASSVVHSYQTHGVYFPQLVTESNKGCLDTMDGRVEVYAMPVAGFTVNASQQCLRDNRFEFGNASSIPVGSFQNQWSFGDGALDDVFEPIHVYDDHGAYDVQLIVTSDKGCADSVMQPMLVFEMPIADFQVDTACKGEDNVFRSAVYWPLNEAGTYQWFIGNSSYNDSVVRHQFPNSGAYPAMLIVKTINGCLDTAEKLNAAVVWPHTIIEFAMERALDSLKWVKYEIQDQSQGFEPFSYEWTFSDGQVFREEGFNVLIGDTGKVVLRIQITDDKGCRVDSMIEFVNYPVNTAFIPGAFTPNKDGLNDVFKITGLYYLKAFELKIFDRWGELLFASDNVENGWDGTFMGKPVQNGVYIYTLYYKNLEYKKKFHKGIISVIR